MVKKDNFLYVILTPPPNPKSAGITYLNDLGSYLRKIGKESVNIYHIEPQGNLYLWSSESLPKQNHWIDPWQGGWIPWSPGIFKRTFGGRQFIVIHGENKHFKWFEDLNVVRYYLAGINDLQKKGVAREGEYKLAWDEMYCKNPDFILCKPTFRKSLDSVLAINTHGRSIDLTYVGKAWIHNSNTPRLNNTIELTRTWPENDDEYFYLLSKTRFIFTYDSITSVVSDAILMGAFPVFMDLSKRNNKDWHDSINKKLSGCYGFIDESYENSLKDFPENRERFIRDSISEENSFFTKLKAFCDSVENFFKE